MSDRPPASTSSPDADTWESLSEPIAWRPSEEYLSRSRLLRFMRRHGIADYAALLQRANDDPEWFWGAVPDDLGLVWQRPYTAVMDTSRCVPWTRWYVGGRLNYVATVTGVPSVEHVVVVRHLAGETPWLAGRDVWWHELVDRQSPECETATTDAEDPYMLIYTSGTTGKPKGAVHVHCGFPLKGAQDMAHLFDVQPDDTLFWLSDIGWMMGPWAISGALMLGATLALYDGTPDYPGPDRLWDFAERHRVSVLGIAPTVVRSLMTHGDEPVRKHDLSALRIIGASGEPWNSGPWHWAFEVVGGGRCPIINYSGGTEISGGIVGCTTITPIKPCAFSGPVPGMAADVVDEQGEPVRNQVGELVIRQPWPGMTRGFWGAPERYEAAYWSRFPGLWVHCDFAAIDADGSS